MTADLPDRDALPDLATFGAVLLDLDGVITPTADLHRRAWSAVFTGFFADRGVAPYTEQDYFDHIDGRPRSEGVAAVLASRGITLPTDRSDPAWSAAGGESGQGTEDVGVSGVAGVAGDTAGDAGDTAGDATVLGLGLLKNMDFLALLDRGIDAYPGSVALLDALDALADLDTGAGGPQVAVVSSSRNARPVLAAAGLIDRFPVIVDGNVAAERGLPGKPAPDTYRYGAELLGVPEHRAVVVEDAVSGVAAGAAGDFGLVLGVDRGAGARALTDAGADIVVADLGELVDVLGTDSDGGAGGDGDVTVSDGPAVR